jgi:hypothetical protein
MKRQGGKNKTRCQQIHFRRRCTERLGFVPSKRELEELINKIQSNKSQFIERQSHRITVWRDNFKDIDIILIYDKIRKQIITVMPYSWWEKESKNEQVG